MNEIGDYILLNPIGQGTFACVRLAEHKIIHTQVAVKIIPRTNFEDPDHVARFQREVDLIKDLDHPFIAEFFEVLEDDTNFYIVMEYVENDNMLNYVNINGELQEDVARHYFCQLISVLEYLHVEKQISHRDLKAENVLLDRYKNIRLIDFGLSNTFSKENQFLKTACGSPAYASPEMIKGEQYTASSDYWSAGVLLYAMVVGQLPFEDDNVQRMMQKIIYTEPKYPNTISAQLRDLLKRLMEKDPQKRITLMKIKEHPWFSQVEYMKIKESHSWRIHSPTAPENDPVDREIVQKMTEFGYDCQPLVEAILCGEISPLTAVYRILRKEKIIDLIGQGNLGSSHPSIGDRRSFRNTHQIPRFRPVPPPPIPSSSPSENRSPRVAKHNRNSMSARKPFGEDVIEEASPLESPPRSANTPQSLLTSVLSARKAVKPTIATIQRRMRSSSTRDARPKSLNFT